MKRHKNSEKSGEYKKKMYLCSGEGILAQIVRFLPSREE